MSEEIHRKKVYVQQACHIYPLGEKLKFPYNPDL